MIKNYHLYLTFFALSSVLLLSVLAVTPDASALKGEGTSTKKFGSSAMQQGLVPCDPGTGIPEDKISAETGKNEFGLKEKKKEKINRDPDYRPRGGALFDRSVVWASGLN